MERGSGKKSHDAIINHQHQQEKRERIQQGIGDEFRPTSSSKDLTTSSTPDFVLQWGNKKRLRCTKIQTKDEPSNPAQRTTARVDRRVIRNDIVPITNFSKQRPPSPTHRVLRNSEKMWQGQGNNVPADHVKVQTRDGKRGSPAPVSVNRHRRHNNSNNDGVGSGSFQKAHEEGNMKGGEGGSSSGSEVIPPAVWPPKFVIALTNKEKEEDFMAIKGSKLPHRPRKRSKHVQSNLMLVSPGAWLCDLSLDRYEVREKKSSKKRPRGLKAMCGSIESDSE